MSEKLLAKITHATFGFGGYQDVMFGLSLTFMGGATGVSDFKGTWGDPPSPHAKWSLEDQSQTFADTCRLLIATLKDAKKDHVGQLVGVPVELTVEGNRLESWRILKEVL